jgi:hypothetical protein
MEGKVQTYCERCGPGLFDEPINAVSNIVFLIAAWTAWRLGKRRASLSLGLWLLIDLSIAVGIGSLMWHTFATPWALYFDVVPILLFQLCFLWIYCRHVAGLNRALVMSLLLAYILAGLWLRQYRVWLNGVLLYAPAIGLSLSIGVYHCVRVQREPYVLLVSALLFCIALICRTIDLIVCRWLPIGTHFLWHVLNGVVVYLAMRSLIIARAENRQSAGNGELGRGNCRQG